MGKFKVYQAKTLADMFGPYPSLSLANYNEVATLECRDLDDAYRLTNHMDKDWTLNREILSCNATCRSTSVGDVIVQMDEGKAFRCMPYNWEEVDRSVLMKEESEL